MADTSRSRAQVARWYLERPAMWGELARAVVQRVRPSPPDEYAEATERCRSVAMPRDEVLERLGIEASSATEREEYKAARQLLADRGVGVAGAADTDFLYAACLAEQPSEVLETGVAHGLSSLAILLALEANGTGHLSSVDMPYRGSTDDSYVGQAVPESMRTRWTLLRLPDRRGLPKAIARSPFDVVHYDSDKTRSGRLFAYPRMWEATRPGGLFISDDVNDNGAFLEFAETVGVEPLVWQRPAGDNYLGAMRRPD